MKPPRYVLARHRYPRSQWLCAGYYPAETYETLTAGGDSIEVGACSRCGGYDIDLEPEVAASKPRGEV